MKKTLFVVAACMIGSQLIAQQDTTAKSLDEVVITANKFEQKQSTTGKVITVITKEQLEKSGGKTLPQVLTEQAGVFISGAYNVPGSVQTVFMRGASSGRTLILLDGIPVNDPSMIYNEFDLNLFSIHHIERIEICKGAQSTLYGSDAIAGVINIITVKKDISKPFNVKATTSFGNKNTIRNNVQLYGKAGKLTYTTRFAKLNTDGFSSANDNAGNNNFDKDAYKGHVANAALQYQALPSLALKTFIQYSKYKADIDAGGFADEKDYAINNDNLMTGAGFVFRQKKVSVTGNYQFGKLKRRYLNDSLDVPGFTIYESNRYGGRTQFAELYGSINPLKWLTVLIGGDYRWSLMNQDYLSISGFGPYESSFSDTSLHQTSFYGSLLFNAFEKKLNIEVGGRFNNHSRYGNNGTYTFNPSLIINPHWRIFGSIASGFKAPSIYQVFDEFSGNTELKPETSVNYEIGVQQLHEKISSRIVYFHRDIKNGIDFNYITFQYFNFVKQTTDGIEVELTTHLLKQLDISANYTFISGEEQTQSRKNFNDTTYSYLLRRPDNSFNINIGWRAFPSFYISINGRSVSQRYDTGGYMTDDVKLKGYFLLGAYADYTLNEHLKFFADAQNLTGKKFFDIRGFNAIPLLVNGGITFEW
jgi:vitamin B12 transporter